MPAPPAVTGKAPARRLADASGRGGDANGMRPALVIVDPSSKRSMTSWLGLATATP